MPPAGEDSDHLIAEMETTAVVPSREKISASKDRALRADRGATTTATAPAARVALQPGGSPLPRSAHPRDHRTGAARPCGRAQAWSHGRRTAPCSNAHKYRSPDRS